MFSCPGVICIQMNKKWLLLAIVILLAAFFIFGRGIAASNSDEAIKGEVKGPPVLLSYPVSIGAPTDNTSGNQTVALKNPTFQELKEFVLADTTHRHPFVPNEYECRNFATDMVNNAVHKGLLAGFVLICYNEGQHAVVAFNTTDRGMIYIEPQTNASIDIKIGGTYQGLEIKQILIAW